MTKTRIGLILGTRPEIIKLSPLIRECEARGLEYTLVHTGQHYSEMLDSVFFERLGLPSADYELGVGSMTHGQQTGEMLMQVEEVLLEEDLDSVLVQGDTNSVLSGAIATSKLDTEIGHVEAGLRSYDRQMPEEMNRVVADHVSDYLFAPTENAAQNLREEGIPMGRIAVTGNTVVDAINQNIDIAESESSILEDRGVSEQEYILLTAHRAENVDDPERLRAILDAVAETASQTEFPVLYPIHPRTQNNIEQYDIAVPAEIQTIDPVGYFDFLTLEANAALAITDSGGVQEEACVLGTPCVTVRNSTERPESVDVGANILTEPSNVPEAARQMLDSGGNWENPFGDGQAAKKILNKLV